MQRTALFKPALPALAALAAVAVIAVPYALQADDGNSSVSSSAVPERGTELGKTGLPREVRDLLARDVAPFARHGARPVDVLARDTGRGPQRLLVGIADGEDRRCMADFVLTGAASPSVSCGRVQKGEILAFRRSDGRGSGYVGGRAPAETAYVVIVSDRGDEVRAPAFAGGDTWPGSFFIESLTHSDAATITAYGEDDRRLASTQVPAL